MFARAYLLATTLQQDAPRARGVLSAFAAERGLWIVARGNGSGAKLGRPELLRRLFDREPGDVLLVEQVDRLSHLLGQHRSTQRKVPKRRADDAALTADIIELATQYGRYGYGRIAALLRDAGWLVNVKRVERIWRREGLKVPAKQPKRGRLWLSDGSCIRLRPERPDHVWSYDFVEDRTYNGRKFRMPGDKR